MEMVNRTKIDRGSKTDCNARADYPLKLRSNLFGKAVLERSPVSADNERQIYLPETRYDVCVLCVVK